jgi:hypothetical protein
MKMDFIIEEFMFNGVVQKCNPLYTGGCTSAPAPTYYKDCTAFAPHLHHVCTKSSREMVQNRGLHQPLKKHV